MCKWYHSCARVIFKTLFMSIIGSQIVHNIKCVLHMRIEMFDRFGERINELEAVAQEIAIDITARAMMNNLH